MTLDAPEANTRKLYCMVYFPKASEYLCSALSNVLLEDTCATDLRAFIEDAADKRGQEGLLVFDGSRTAELDEVIEDANSPLPIGPITVWRQQFSEGRKQKLKNGIKLFSAGRKGTGV